MLNLKSPAVGALMLALVFTIIYVVVRNMPVPQCELAHLGDSLNEEGALEYCGDEETIFFNLEELIYPVNVTLTVSNKPQVGKPVNCIVELKTTTGKPITPENVIVSHTERIHLMAVDKSLDDYHHLHPQGAGAPGKWEFSFVPNKPGPYQLYFDFVTLHGVRRTLVHSEVITPGEGHPPVLAESNHHTVDDGIPFELVIASGKLKAGEESRITLRAKDLGKPQSVPQTPKLQLVMGAFSHVVTFDPERVGFAHLHPVNPVEPGQVTHAPSVDFAFKPDLPGMYRLWAQIKFNDAEHFLPFNVEVMP